MKKRTPKPESSSRVFLATKHFYPLVAICVPDGHPTIEHVYGWTEVKKAVS